MGKFGVPQKLLCLLKDLHKDVLVKFKVEGFEHEVKTIGFKQGEHFRAHALHHLHGWCYD